MMDKLLDFMMTPDETIMIHFAECLKPFFTFGKSLFIFFHFFFFNIIIASSHQIFTKNI
jgi:hypothetical protein